MRGGERTPPLAQRQGRVTLKRQIVNADPDCVEAQTWGPEGSLQRRLARRRLVSL